MCARTNTGLGNADWAETPEANHVVSTWTLYRHRRIPPDGVLTFVTSVLLPCFRRWICLSDTTLRRRICLSDTARNRLARCCRHRFLAAADVRNGRACDIHKRWLFKSCFPDTPPNNCCGSSCLRDAARDGFTKFCRKRLSHVVDVWNERSCGIHKRCSLVGNTLSVRTVRWKTRPGQHASRALLQTCASIVKLQAGKFDKRAVTPKLQQGIQRDSCCDLYLMLSSTSLLSCQGGDGRATTPNVVPLSEPAAAAEKRRRTSVFREVVAGPLPLVMNGEACTCSRPRALPATRDQRRNGRVVLPELHTSYFILHYRKRGSVSYIVREWLLWVVERERERERERETPVTSIDITLKSRVIMHMITSTARRERVDASKRQEAWRLSARAAG